MDVKRSSCMKLVYGKQKIRIDYDINLFIISFVFSSVLPNWVLLHIIEKLPISIQDMLDCWQSNAVSPAFLENVAHLHQLILKARNQSV